jgi:glycosyltransferase involved in cell wall biosynthesis
MRLLVTVTFKPNQLRAHLEPILALDEVESVTLVSDEDGTPLPKLSTVTPPRWLRHLLGRALAKFVICLRIARHDRPDWIIGYHLLPHGITASTVGRLSKTHSLYHQIGGPVEWEGGGWQSDNAILGRIRKAHPILEGLLLSIVRRCTVVATMGNSGRDALIAHGISPDRIVVIPAGVDTARFHARDEDRAPDYDIVTVSDLIERKRIPDLLNAVARLRRSRPQLRVAIIGTGPLEENLKQQAETLEVSNNVDFLGFRSDVEEVLTRSAIFVLASRYEGLSVALSEAMAAGLPVVVSDVGEVRTLVRDGQNGYIYPAGDVDQLADRLCELLSDQARARAFGRAAAATVADVASVGRISRIYAEVLHGGDRQR